MEKESGAAAETHFGFRTVPEAEKEKLVYRHFENVASYYDRLNTVLSFGMHYVWKRSAVEMLGLRTGERVLDVCGGTADLAILAARSAGASGNVVLYDINRAMMEAGRPKAAKSPFGWAIQYVQGNAEQISFPTGSFDAAMVGFGIRNLTHFEQGFREMHRVLKPGGRFLCLEFSQPPAPWFRALYDFYSFRVMPLVGQLLVGNRQGYTYLPESIRLFPGPEELSGLFRSIGFGAVQYRSFTQGIAVAHIGVKNG
jgi:demethylmenaquinone methyltransferase / 2-methoxy-6-polyprenyl-1,4-benzoquinol methylase